MSRYHMYKKLCYLRELVDLQRKEYNIIVLPKGYSSTLLLKSSHFENIIFCNIMSMAFRRNISFCQFGKKKKTLIGKYTEHE